MNKGHLSIVLHAHLPYVHHPEYDRFFEENWLFEAMLDCYLPLIDLFDRLLNDGIAYRLTVSLSPPLITMLRDPLLQERFVRHLHKLQQLCEKEVLRTRTRPELHRLALANQQRYRQAQLTYHNHYQGDLLAAFAKHQRAGNLELITTAATHGFLPLLNSVPAAVISQIRLGLACFEANFGFRPQGFWLPECAYFPGLETALKAAGVDYFFVDSHGILDASEAPTAGIFAPLDCGNGVMAFGRDPACSHQVWSADHGYPGDPDYREYYRDIGFDLPLDYIGPYILDGHTRINTGIKYHRISGGPDKLLYDPPAASAKAQLHARDFVAKRHQQLAHLQGSLPQAPIIVAPYDAELFGHWWHEGPQWLEAVLRLCAADQALQTVSCGDHLQQTPSPQVSQPAASSWGDQGYSEYWLNDSNAWIYPLLNQAGEQMAKLVGDLDGKAINPLQQRALNQALRSLLLAQASDWPFILKSGTSVDYAKKRLTDHLARFNYLHDSFRKNRVDQRYLSALEIMDDIFPDLDFRDFRA